MDLYDKESEEPFYVKDMSPELKDWLKEKAYKSYIEKGDEEEVARKKSEDFLNEKMEVAEEMFGPDYEKEFPCEKEGERKTIPDDMEIPVPDELDAYTKDLEDYLDKNPDAKKKNYY